MTKAQAYDGLPMHADQVDVTTDIVAAVIQEQFPRWSGKPIQLLPSTGTVNAVFRIGDDLSAPFPLRPADPAEALAVMEREAQASACRRCYAAESGVRTRASHSVRVLRAVAETRACGYRASKPWKPPAQTWSSAWPPAAQMRVA